MRVRLLTGLSGSAYTLGPGDEWDFPQDEALRLVDAGFAVPVVEQTIETADRKPTFERRGRKGKQNVVSSDNDGGAD